ncbi:hypothetical protein JXD38_03350 [candidate division WOR-3 bacterium]|nr:hypothetical protein [candidate division WOR-3 bacterium]
MRLLATWMICAACCFGGQSLSLTAGKTGTSSIPVSAPWTDLGSVYIELRLHGVSCSADNSPIWRFGKSGSGSLQVRCDANGNIDVIDWTVSQTTSASPSGPDILVRAGRNISTGLLFIEVWNVDGSGYAVGTNTHGATGTANWGGGSVDIGYANTNVHVAFARILEGTIGLASPPPAIVDDGDLGDWELEGDTTDDSPNEMDLSISGVSYTGTPTYNPVAVAEVDGQASWTSRPTVRAGFPATLTGKNSINFNEDNQTLSHFWTQLSGPTTLVWDDRTAASPEIRGTLFGQYTVKLTVTDSAGLSGSSTLTIGAIPTDDNGVVIHSDPLIYQVFGPLTRHGTSPWPYIDERHEAFAEHFYADSPGFTEWEDDWDDALGGTIAVTENSAIVTGTGTDFQNDFCSGGTSPDADSAFIIWYDTGQGSYGRRYYTITSCDSATQVTLTAQYKTTGSDSGLNYSRWGCRSCLLGASDNANYYDNVLAQYSMYYRSGFTDFLTRAREMASRNWRGPVSDEGRMRYFGGDTPPQDGSKLSANRIWAFYGTLWWMYESDQGETAWNWMEAAIDDWLNDGGTSVGDVREVGYRTGYVGLAALLDAGDAEKQAEYEADSDDVITVAWLARLQPGGHYQYSASGYTEGWCGTGVAVTNGSTSVTGNGTSGCWPGSQSNGTNYLLIDGDSLAYRISSGNSTSLTLTAPYEGATQSDIGYQMINLVGLGVQPFLQGNGMAGVNFAYEASGNEDFEDILPAVMDWTISTGVDPSTRGLYYAAEFNNCEAETTRPTEYAGEKCVSGIGGARLYSCEVMRAFSARYLMDGDPSTLAAGDNLVSATFGALGGPGTDGSYAFELSNSGTIDADKAKNFGFCFGAGNAPSWLGARLGGAETRPLITVQQGFRLADVPGATTAVFTVTSPAGETTEVGCATSPCDLSSAVDYRLGEHILTVTYLDGADKVLAVSDPQLLRVR